MDLRAGGAGHLSEDPAPEQSRSEHVAFNGFDPLNSKAKSAITNHNL